MSNKVIPVLILNLVGVMLYSNITPKFIYVSCNVTPNLRFAATSKLPPDSLQVRM